jgi:hypothetical protein
MNISARITGISYEPVIVPKILKPIHWSEFDINIVPPVCAIMGTDKQFALSKWVSPKRTRSYPYARVYDTISYSRKITVIPVIKDEGLDGDRDFIQWDTISLMSLLEVYIVFGYYDQAHKNSKYANKVTSHKFNNDAVKCKLLELTSYQSSALHWNIKQLNESLADIVNLQSQAYQEISTKTGVRFKSTNGLDKFKQDIKVDLDNFMASSRSKSQQAQSREQRTSHEGEYLETDTKSNITIENYLGGKYFFTVDEVAILNDRLNLIESKHTSKGLLPSDADIKDGLIKMVLYRNLTQVHCEAKLYTEVIPVLKLSSVRILGNIKSNSSVEEIGVFLTSNHVKSRTRELIMSLFNEATTNSFEIEIVGYDRD